MFIETNPVPAHYTLRRIGSPLGVPCLQLSGVTSDIAAKADAVLAKSNSYRG